MNTKILIMAGAAALAVAGAAMAAVTFDAGTGTGFVGKGDVQLALNMNNKQLQDAANSLDFEAVSSTVTEQSWVCTKDNGNINERSRTTTTSIQGVVEAVARERNQITGFNLLGYLGAATVTIGATDGPALNSCPSQWVLTTPAGDAEVVENSSVLTVNGVPLQ